MNTASIHKESKLLYISAIRFVAMIMIIACHICQNFDSQWAWWLNVGVQIFLVLSGFLYGSKDIKEPIKWLKRNTNKILLPYYIFILISILLYYIFAPNLISPKRIIEALFCVGTIQGIENLWFVGYILFCYLLTPYLAILTKYLKDKSKKHNIIVLLLFFLIFFIISDLIDFYFKPDKILCYFIGYFVAFFTKNYGDNIINWIFIISCPLAIILKITYLNSDFFLVDYISIFSHLVLGVALTFGLMLLFKKIQLKHFNLLLNFSDKYSYHIYLVHQLFILSPLTLMFLTPSYTTNILISIIVIVITGVLLQKISSKIIEFTSK